MKKHDEGYILAYVFIILVVICMIAVSVLTIPLNNLRIQQAEVEQMTAHYAAQGMMEKTLGAMYTDLDKIDQFRTLTTSTEAKSNAEICEVDGKHMGILNMMTIKRVCDVEAIEGDGIYVTSPIVWTADLTTDQHSCSFTLTAVYGAEMVSTKVELKNLVVGPSIEVPAVVCSSYSISEFTPPATQPQEGGSQDAA